MSSNDVLPMPDQRQATATVVLELGGATAIADGGKLILFEETMQLGAFDSAGQNFPPEDFAHKGGAFFL
jgi:hypothetical protein